jgi:uncharacterized membrane protein (DUF2068 family)
MTVMSGGRVLLDDAARQAAEPVVPFVLWFNAFAGLGYIVAGIGLWLARRWGAWLSMIIALATLLVFAGFGLHVAVGGDFAPRTAYALLLRSVVWVLIAAFAARRLLGRH